MIGIRDNPTVGGAEVILGQPRCLPVTHDQIFVLLADARSGIRPVDLAENPYGSSKMSTGG
jgi:hypothetical protein